MNTKITALGVIQTNLGNVMGLIPDHHNKADIVIKWVMNFLISSVYKSYIYVMRSSVRCAIVLCLKINAYTLRKLTIIDSFNELSSFFWWWVLAWCSWLLTDQGSGCWSLEWLWQVLKIRQQLFSSYCGTRHHEQWSLLWRSVWRQCRKSRVEINTSVKMFWKWWIFRSAWRTVTSEGQTLLSTVRLKFIPLTKFSVYVLGDQQHCDESKTVDKSPTWTSRHWRNSIRIENGSRS